ncbi:MAG TPA: lytic transglycosylase domain-containing protein [Candidatus Angelobacter sp.]|nr:lytic transglycosylase domain-containing protein [Candidatus Angelobacter sp.]
MKWLRNIAVGLGVLSLAAPAFSAEVAVLRNGFSINFERKEVKGDVTRLYVRGGFLEVPSSEIVSYEPAAEEPPDVPPAPPVNATPANPIATNAVAQTQTAAASPNGDQLDLDQVVRDASSRYRLDPDFVNSVIKAESNFKIHAVSRKGAQGLMQLMPGTAAQLGVSNAFDPKANVEAGTAYLSSLLDLYHDDAVKALAAYNAGSHRVDQYHGVPPYMETREYVAKIVRDFNAKKMAQRKAAGAPAANAGKPAGTALKPVTKKKSRRTQPQEATVSKPQKPA